MQTRRKYKYPSRGEAEDACAAAEQRQLWVEWIFSAVLSGRTRAVGHTKDWAVGYVVMRHIALVYELNRSKQQLNRIGGIWDVDDGMLKQVIDMLHGFNDESSRARAGLLAQAQEKALWEMKAASRAGGSVQF